MARKVWIVVALLGLLVSAGPWVGAALMNWLSATGDTCLTVGYAHGDAWLLNAVIYPDGVVLFQRFEPNATDHDGLYALRLRMGVAHPFSLRGLFPQRSSRRSFSKAVTAHLLLPNLMFASLGFYTLVVPFLRRRHRRRRGQCLACGYDLRGAPSQTCSECGHLNLYHTPQPASSP
jgi:hypothetical protein